MVWVCAKTPHAPAGGIGDPEAEFVGAIILLDLHQDYINASLEFYIEAVAVDSQAAVDVPAGNSFAVQVQQEAVVASQEDPCGSGSGTREVGNGIRDDALGGIAAREVYDEAVPDCMRLPRGAVPALALSRPRPGLAFPSQVVLLKRPATGPFAVLIERSAQKPVGDESREVFDFAERNR